MTIRYAYPDIHDVRNTRACRKCGEVKSVTEFPWRKDGQQYLSHCYACVAERARNYWRHRRNVVWTEAKNRELLKLILAGKTDGEAAVALEMTLAAVKSQRQRMSFPPFARPVSRRPQRKAWPQKRVARLKRLRDRNLSFTECAAILGTTRSAISSATRYLKEGARP
jgi:hypothetical protein